MIGFKIIKPNDSVWRYGTAGVDEFYCLVCSKSLDLIKLEHSTILLYNSDGDAIDVERCPHCFALDSLTSLGRADISYYSLPFPTVITRI